jgi:hypothetical protein
VFGKVCVDLKGRETSFFALNYKKLNVAKKFLSDTRDSG